MYQSYIVCVKAADGAMSQAINTHRIDQFITLLIQDLYDNIWQDTQQNWY